MKNSTVVRLYQCIVTGWFSDTFVCSVVGNVRQRPESELNESATQLMVLKRGKSHSTVMTRTFFINEYKEQVDWVLVLEQNAN